jgi:uncharacterized membrane protein
VLRIKRVPRSIRIFMLVWLVAVVLLGVFSFAAAEGEPTQTQYLVTLLTLILLWAGGVVAAYAVSSEAAVRKRIPRSIRIFMRAWLLVVVVLVGILAYDLVANDYWEGIGLEEVVRLTLAAVLAWLVGVAIAGVLYTLVRFVMRG